MVDGDMTGKHHADMTDGADMADDQTANQGAGQTGRRGQKGGGGVDVTAIRAAALETLRRNLDQGPPASQVAAARTLLEAIGVLGAKGQGVKPGTAPASTMSGAEIATEIEALSRGET